MQNTPFLALLRPIFALETKIALTKGMGDEGPNVILTRKNGFQPVLRSFFFEIILIWTKKRPNFGEDLFFGRRGRSSYFGQKNRPNLITDRSKSGSRSCDVVSSLQNSPPNANSWLRA